MYSWTWIYYQLSYFMQSYNDIVVVLKCHIVWSVLLLEVMCCTIPIVLKWPFRAACMWLRQQEADQERKSAIACLLLSGMFLSATEVSTKEWWRKRWLLEIECFLIGRGWKKQPIPFNRQNNHHWMGLKTGGSEMRRDINDQQFYRGLTLIYYLWG